MTDSNQQPNYAGQPGYPSYGGHPQNPPPAQQPEQPGYSPRSGYPDSGYNQPHLQPVYQQPGVNPPHQPGYGQDPYAGQYDQEDPKVKGFYFNDESIRKAFIRKVYSILMCQLIVSMGFIALCTFHDGTKRFLACHPKLLWVAVAVLLVTLMAMACCDDVRRTAPTNFIFLGLFTLAQSFLLGVVTAKLPGDVVLLAMGITAAVCLSLTLFAFQTKWDFTMLGGFLFVALIMLMILGFVAMFFPGHTMQLVYASGGALLFCVYLIYDTQLMMGGKHKYAISPEEYIFAALNLYIDIISIFLRILKITSATRD